MPLDYTVSRNHLPALLAAVNCLLSDRPSNRRLLEPHVTLSAQSDRLTAYVGSFSPPTTCLGAITATLQSRICRLCRSLLEKNVGVPT